MTFREAADRESGLCYNIGVQVNLLFDCPKKGASMKQSSNKKSREATAFLYERLSRDDNLEGESYSIGNQKKLLTKVAKEKGYTNLVHFLDDGISGVTMNRPGFVEMMQQLEQGKASAVFVKDLSRLGRNYIEVGRLTEEFFPDHDMLPFRTTSTRPREKTNWHPSETCSMSGMPVTSARNAVSVIKSKATPANRWDFLPMDISRTRTIPSIGSLMKKLHKLSGAFLI